jgi:Cu/Ag efflux pump CusA
MFGMSFIFVIFNDDAEIYWARTRVLERLNFAQKALPQGVTPTLGPDGTGVGHVFWYTLQGDGYDLGELRAVQDWYVKFALQNVEGCERSSIFRWFSKAISGQHQSQQTDLLQCFGNGCGKRA